MSLAAEATDARAALRYRLAAMLYDALGVLGIWIATIVALVTVIGDAVVGAWVQACFRRVVRLFRFLLVPPRANLGHARLAAQTPVHRAIPANPALRRFVAGLASFLTLGFGFAWMLIDRDKLTWGDRDLREHSGREPRCRRDVT